MKRLDLPFIDLFEMLQSKGMSLAPEQYDLLRQAFAKGFGLKTWDQDWNDLRDLCRVLWVKPSANYDERIFEETFSEYVRQKQRELRSIQQQNTSSITPSRQPVFPEGQLPQLPPRRIPRQQPETPQKQAPVAVKTGVAGLPEVDKKGFHLSPRNLPLDSRTLLDSWRLLRQPIREGLDFETELLVLVDDSNVMLPFAPALLPLVKAIEEQRITPAKLYRFTAYPDEYLHHWQNPTEAILFSSVLAQMHPRRTVVIIWSEAGATSESIINTEYRSGLVQFLARLSPCLRDLIWLNPLPPNRWTNTLAQELAFQLDGRMIYLDQLLPLCKQLSLANRCYFRVSP